MPGRRKTVPAQAAHKKPGEPLRYRGAPGLFVALIRRACGSVEEDAARERRDRARIEGHTGGLVDYLRLLQTATVIRVQEVEGHAVGLVVTELDWCTFPQAQ